MDIPKNTAAPLRHPEAEKGKKIAIVVGGGFAGLNAAKRMAGEKDVHVVLLDQRNHHLFQPLLYQVATAGLNPGDIAVPIRSQFSHDQNVEIHMEKVMSVDLEGKILHGNTMSMHFDYLVLALGARHSYFGKNEWEEFAPGLKTLEQATEIRRRVLLAFEEAENELDPKRREALLTFVIVGGGPTGVELAGAIADLSRTVLTDDFSHINTKNAKVLLLEAGPKILGMFSEKLWQHAIRDLNTLGVEVRPNSRVEAITADGVKVGEQFIPSKTVVWAAGVQATPLEFTPNVERDRAGRVKVGNDFSIPGHPDIFVIGDMTSFDIGEGKLLPGLAPAAIQAGKHAGDMILRSIRGEGRTGFKYNDKGQMATIGRNRAIAETGALKMTGYFAWLAWLFVHIFYLIGFKNRVAVMAQWVWNYVFSKRGARLITAKEWKLGTS